MVAKIVTLLCLCILCGSGCLPPPPNRQIDFRKMVISGDRDVFCSVEFYQKTRASAKNKFEVMSSMVDSLRRIDNNIFASYVSFPNLDSVTIVNSSPCRDLGMGVRNSMLSVAALYGFVTKGRFFTPPVLNPNKYSFNTLTDYLAYYDGDGHPIEECSVAVLVDKYVRYPDPTIFEKYILDARDIYGVPIIFSANIDDETYMTFYRSCDDVSELSLYIRHLFNRHGRQIIRGFRRASRPELKRVYGSIF